MPIYVRYGTVKKMTNDNQDIGAREKEIRFLLKDFLKVIKIVSMYPENNPLPQSLKRSFAERLVSVVQAHGEFRIEVDRDRLVFEQETVFEDKSKEESLAGLFYGTGISEFSFKFGLDVEDIYRLLDLVREYVNSPDKSLDLAGSIWEAEINGFVFRTVEDVALSDYDSNFNIQEYISDSDSGRMKRSQFGTDQVEDYTAIFESNDDSYQESKIQLDDSAKIDIVETVTGKAAPGSGSPFTTGVPMAPAGEEPMEDAGDWPASPMDEAAEAPYCPEALSTRPQMPDTTIILNDEFRLSREEEAMVQELLAEDAGFDTYESTLELLKEMLLQEGDMDAFYETVTVSEKVLTDLVRAGRLPESGQLLQYFKELEQRLPPDKGLWAERLRDAVVTAGSRDRLKVLTESLNDHPELGVGELRRHLDNFGWEALSAITDLMGELEHRLHREALSDYLTARGKDNIDIVARGVYDKRWYVVRNAVTILAGIGDSKAIAYLKRVVKHDDRRVRLQLVSSLGDCPSDEAVLLLKECVSDPDAEIRKKAVSSLVVRKNQAALDTITDILNEEGFQSLGQDDQQAMLNAFSMLGGELAVSYLSQLILKANPFRDSSVAFYRVAAFEALTLNRSEKCESFLIKMSGSWRPDIKQQAVAALQRRREIIYGENG